MNAQNFKALLARFSDAATRGDGKTFSECFTEDGVYHDYIYGPHAGRASIEDMLVNLFHRDAANYDWRMFDPVIDGNIGYAWSLSKFSSTIPQFQGKEVVIDGMSRFVVRDGLIAEYRESVNGGVAMAQLGVEPARMAKVMTRWSTWLRERPEVKAYLKR
ncbi:MAG: nuclear transport factor 2 family protein [Alphaproteobacteria bacterium]|nr:nuclear transport factor 2 family protein [Alphaproteobacteria bacterium]